MELNISETEEKKQHISHEALWSRMIEQQKHMVKAWEDQMKETQGLRHEVKPSFLSTLKKLVGMEVRDYWLE